MRRRPALVGALALAGLVAVPLAAPAAAAPDDPLYDQQWGLMQVNAVDAWLANRGEGVTVAVVDSGVSFDHPDLAANLVPGATFLGCPGDAGEPCGDGGWLSGPETRRASASTHGTHVSGVVAAVADNGRGVASVAPRATILPVKVVDEEGGTASDVALGIEYALDEGADVINLSLGTPLPTSPVTGETGPVSGDDDPLVAALQRAEEAGVTVVAAAGNQGLPLCSDPASIEGVFCVAASDRREGRAVYSNEPAKLTEEMLALTAPGGSAMPVCGEDVLSTVPLGSTSEQCGYGDGYVEMAGTSFSSPHVAGVAALLVAQGRTEPEVTQALISTARNPVSGNRGTFDPTYGYGIVDAATAVASARRSEAATGDAEARSITDACPPGEVPSADVSDVPEGSTAREAVDCVAWYEVAVGKVDGTYAPLEPVNREQIAAFLARLVRTTGGSLPASPEDAFDDDDTSQFEDEINALAAAGVVNGTGEGTYDPQGRVTRGQMASFLARTYEFRTSAILTAPADFFGDDDGSIHETNINRIAETGFAAGAVGGGYEPEEDVTRAQMALFLSRVLDLLVENGYSTTPAE